MSKIRTFLIEDNQVILDSLTAALEEEANVQVVGCARDAREAMAWMDSRTDGCDVVVIDVFLRSGSGLSVLERMKEYQAPPERIVLTNYATPEMRSRCHALGAIAVFDKSRELEELLTWFVSRPAPLR